MPSPIKLCREPWSKGIQHLPAVRETTKRVSRKFRRDTKRALKMGIEPPVKASGGERY